MGHSETCPLTIIPVLALSPFCLFLLHTFSNYGVIALGSLKDGGVVKVGQQWMGMDSHAVSILVLHACLGLY